jgi:hypothetical protein
MWRALVLIALTGCLHLAKAGEAVKLSEAKRDAPRLPNLGTTRPLYGLFLFGDKGEERVWAVLDQSRSQSSVYDVLLLDLNGDGDLTQAGERFVAGSTTDEASCKFEIGRFKELHNGRTHTEFSITWRPKRVSYRMLWAGEKTTMGGYGTDPESYGNFSTSAETAPLLVPGPDRPLQFQHWMSATLRRDRDNEFKVFIGNMGLGPGTFSCVDDKFLPPDDYVVGTLLYEDKSGVRQSLRFDMKRRC